jgi:hypothetical protein
MRYIILALFLVGCGDVMPPAEMPPPLVTVSASDPFACKLDADQVACHCTIPAFSSEALAESGTRCDFLRGVAANLY